MTPHEITKLMESCQARTAREDEQFDKYWALPDRPRPIVMMSVFEGGRLRPIESIDLARWEAWLEANP